MLKFLQGSVDQISLAVYSQLVPKVISYQVNSYPRSSRTQGQLVPKYNKIHKINERVHY